MVYQRCINNLNFYTFLRLDRFHFPIILGILAAILFSTSILHAQKKKKTGGGPPPRTGDNTEISQSGDNKRFAGGRDATTTNPGFKSNKGAIKEKQKQSSSFKGNDLQKRKTGKEFDESQKESSPTDQSGYKQNRDRAMESKEKPSQDMHHHQGEIVVKKKSPLHGKDPSEIDHTGRKTDVTDHTKYQGYRKKAFEQKESNMDHLNSQGSAQYGSREEESNFSLEKRKSMRQSKERERFEYSGDQLPKALSTAGSNYQGDIDAPNKEQNQKDKQKQQYDYQGDLNLEARDQMRKDKQKDMANYSGDKDLGDRDEMRRDKQKEMANYSGDLDLESRDKMRREKQKEIAANSGDIDMRDVNKKAKEIRKKEKVISKYSGDILVKTLMARDNKNRIKAKKIANWQGDIVVNKKRKGAHPSAAYRGGKIANSYKAREKYRKKMLKKYGRNPGIETPNYQKQKDEKPKYDKDEGKIWDVQKYKESKTKP